MLISNHALEDMTEIAPSVIIYDLHQAQHVLGLQRPVTLLSAPGAASQAGCLWWKLLIDAAGLRVAGAAAPDVFMLNPVQLAELLFHDQALRNYGFEFVEYHVDRVDLATEDRLGRPDGGPDESDGHVEEARGIDLGLATAIRVPGGLPFCVRGTAPRRRPGRTA